MEMIQKAKEYETLWGMLFPPECEMPTQRQFLIWLSSFSDPVIEHGIKRTALKYLKGGLSPDAVGRFASGVMKHTARETQAAVVCQ